MQTDELRQYVADFVRCTHPAARKGQSYNDIAEEMMTGIQLCGVWGFLYRASTTE